MPRDNYLGHYMFPFVHFGMELRADKMMIDLLTSIEINNGNNKFPRAIQIGKHMVDYAT